MTHPPTGTPELPLTAALKKSTAIDEQGDAAPSGLIDAVQAAVLADHSHHDPEFRLRGACENPMRVSLDHILKR